MALSQTTPQAHRRPSYHLAYHRSNQNSSSSSDLWISSLLIVYAENTFFQPRRGILPFYQRRAARKIIDTGVQPEVCATGNGPLLVANLKATVAMPPRTDPPLSPAARSPATTHCRPPGSRIAPFAFGNVFLPVKAFSPERRRSRSPPPGGSPPAPR